MTPERGAALAKDITYLERSALYALYPPPEEFGDAGQREWREGVEEAYREASREIRETLRLPLAVMVEHQKGMGFVPDCRCGFHAQPCWFQEWVIERNSVRLRRQPLRLDATS
ncbi:hypothetical protein [Streptomyces sp. MZ04]|uniref:hypothetical protein n=1 Tax=Streptomyces sp. MZ04 TaxID=2559236 RepID=UPI001100CF0C|nr:hypothetical protein [Streptomyces sp. MZ04]TGA91582.1 hypothetical protein E2651_37835 [Streptomyces sp. MZ04]